MPPAQCGEGMLLRISLEFGQLRTWRPQVRVERQCQLLPRRLTEIDVLRYPQNPANDKTSPDRGLATGASMARLDGRSSRRRESLGGDGPDSKGSVQLVLSI
jgi:hypothetical protein